MTKKCLLCGVEMPEARRNTLYCPDCRKVKRRAANRLRMSANRRKIREESGISPLRAPRCSPGGEVRTIRTLRATNEEWKKIQTIARQIKQMINGLDKELVLVKSEAIKAVAAESLRNQTRLENLVEACDRVMASVGPLTAVIKDADLDEDEIRRLMEIISELQSVQDEIRQLSAATTETATKIRKLSGEIQSGF